MGHSFVPIENGLYGFKTELKEKLRDGNPPSWLYKARTAKKKRITADKWAEMREEAAEKARRRAKELRESDRDYSDRSATAVVEFRLLQKPSSGSLGIGHSRTDRYPPKGIRENMSVSREEAQRHTGYHHVNGRDYRIRVTIGERGGINDVELGRDFHH